MNLVDKFLKVAETPNIKLITVREIGEIGVRTLSVSEVAEWNALKEAAERTVKLVKLCVVHPKDFTQVFESVSEFDLKRFPADIVEDIVYHALRHNGLVRDKKADGAELKN